MLRISTTLFLPLLFLPGAALSENKEKSHDVRKSLQAFNTLIGKWKGTGIPHGSREEQQRGFWIEKMNWSWQFKGKDAWLQVKFAKSKNFTRGELRYLPKKQRYQFTLHTPQKKELVFQGKLNKRRLELTREDPASKEKQLLSFRFLHSNRFLYSYAVIPAGTTLTRRVYQVGATKEGVPFAAGSGQPECIVSGGLGTIQVSYKGKTYYVCCGGCRTEFLEDPEKYIKEYEQKKKDKK